MPAKTIIQIRKGTSEEWASVNPTLMPGEMGLEENTYKLKSGDGSTSWNELEYVTVNKVDGGNLDAAAPTTTTAAPTTTTAAPTTTTAAPTTTTAAPNPITVSVATTGSGTAADPYIVNQNDFTVTANVSGTLYYRASPPCPDCNAALMLNGVQKTQGPDSYGSEAMTVAQTVSITAGIFTGQLPRYIYFVPS